jgi:cytoskeletal protein CcmA (bactofilin family)
LRLPSPTVASSSAAPTPLAQRRENAGVGLGSKIAPGLSIRGRISGDAPLHFEGTLDGPIHLRDADLNIGEHGVIRGAIEAREIQIQGSVEGDVTATVRILLRSGCQVTGQLTSPRIAVEDGAHFSGRVEMIRAGANPAGGNPAQDAPSPAERDGVRDIVTEAPPLFAGQPTAIVSPASSEALSGAPFKAASEFPAVREEP